MVIICCRCMSSLVSSRLPSSLHLHQGTFPLMGLASGTVYSSVLFSFTCRLYAFNCPGTVALVRLISPAVVESYVISSAYFTLTVKECPMSHYGKGATSGSSAYVGANNWVGASRAS